MDDLKPCPFCGNDEIKVDRIDGHMCAWCTNCTAQGPTSHFGPDGTAQGAWNDVRCGEENAAMAAEQRAEAAEAEAERLRSAISETLRLADIYAGVASHNAEAEPETAGEAWRSPYMATMRELRRAIGGAA